MGEECWACPDFEACPEQELSFVEHLPYIVAKASTLQLVNREKNVNKIQAAQHGGESCLGRKTRRADFCLLPALTFSSTFHKAQSQQRNHGWVAGFSCHRERSLSMGHAVMIFF